MQSQAGIANVAVVGNYLPRQCGIATFTTDLVQSMSQWMENGRCWAVAVNDRMEGYDYPGEVRFEIPQTQLNDYRLAAEFLNIQQPDVVCLQHEYGIFGGPAGSHVLKLLSELRIPVVTTLHTVLAEPEEEYRKVMLRLAELSDRLVVMSSKAVALLRDVYGVDEAKIVYIAHGIPDIPFDMADTGRERFAEEGKKLLLTFGLLSRNKGIEYAIRALPAVVERYPDFKYIVVGATHPHVLKDQGESYRLQLQQEVRKLGLQDHVDFHNRFVTPEELWDYLAAADIYLTPYVEAAQITSGTLAYALGSGKAVISTPYWYAEEMLDDQRGILVPFRDAAAISEALISLLTDDGRREAMRRRAYTFMREAVWKEVGRRYLEVFGEVRRERALRPRAYRPALRPANEQVFRQELPALKLGHLLSMTDYTGLLQHARYTAPDRNHGYCTDDNARALMLMALAHELLPDYSPRYEEVAGRYLAFLLHAFDSGRGRFRNFMTYGRHWLEAVGSEDSHGRALWGLGVAVGRFKEGRQLPLASTLFKQALPAVEFFSSPRALAFTLLGIDAYLEGFRGDSEARRMRVVLAGRLFTLFQENSSDEWPWPEESLSYDNVRLAQALILSGRRLQHEEMRECGLRVLQWLSRIQTEDGHFVPVGNHGWYSRGGTKARFDQQPLEAHAMIDACIDAFRLTRSRVWLDRAMQAFHWFLGLNDLSLPLYDAKTGGCRDGLQSDSLNQNQGAESTLAWLLSLTALHWLSTDEILFNARNRESLAEKENEE